MLQARLRPAFGKTLASLGRWEGGLSLLLLPGSGAGLSLCLDPPAGQKPWPEPCTQDWPVSLDELFSDQVRTQGILSTVMGTRTTAAHEFRDLGFTLQGILRGWREMSRSHRPAQLGKETLLCTPGVFLFLKEPRK